MLIIFWGGRAITIKESAYAKINLSLDVLRRRDDGYHDLRMVMQTVDLCDELSLTLTEEPVFKAGSNMPYLPRNENNLAVKASRLYFQAAGLPGGVSLFIEKRIPVGAGLGGGSADAAAVLRALDRHAEKALGSELLGELALQCGSDVPFCLYGGTQLAEGRGDELWPLPALADCALLICKPYISVSTAEAFSNIKAAKLTRRPDTGGMLRAIAAGDIIGTARRMYNVFEEPVSKRHKEIYDIHMLLLEYGAHGVTMSGTGSAVIGMFLSSDTALPAFDRLRSMYRDTFLTRPCRALPETRGDEK